MLNRMAGMEVVVAAGEACLRCAHAPLGREAEAHASAAQQ